MAPKLDLYLSRHTHTHTHTQTDKNVETVSERLVIERENGRESVTRTYIHTKRDRLILKGELAVQACQYKSSPFRCVTRRSCTGRYKGGTL